ncbi:hypothetical protein [Serratia sp. DD3]|uniref:hypothetical protein n=1 Tax=Serratia sp. DD3 TaxID=1410619 RepID=UPI0003C52673|nr:hypothetical protein [Serratia sp. DD3]KEY57888.1 hypothetical protein SRDD_32000 [Serratia sp. DD3]
MKFSRILGKNYSLFFLLVLLNTNIVLADSDKCSRVQDLAKNDTINGESNIPAVPFAVANKSKVFFYSAPDEGCKQDEMFLVLGDYLYAYKIHQGFTYVNYITINGKEVKGWVNSAEIQALSPLANNTVKKRLNITDFIVVDHQDWVGLGSSFSQSQVLSKEKELYHGYIGDFPNANGGLDKFNSHEYSNIAITSSNVGYHERLWDIDDDYIIASISLTSPKYNTIRGIKVGDTLSDILKAYEGIKADSTKDNITYTLGKMALTFKLAKNRTQKTE